MNNIADICVVFTIKPNEQLNGQADKQNFDILEQFSDYGVITLDVDDKNPNCLCQIFSEIPQFWREKLAQLGLEYTESVFQDADYLKTNEMDFQPLQIGDYFVCHDNHTHPTPPDSHRLIINAGTAFGTGRHATTSLCMELLQECAPLPIESVFDCGTGTGILAMVARHQWQNARIIISDNDPIAIKNARDNFRINALKPPIYCVAKGFNHPLIIKNAPFDIVIANILYPVLHQLAPTTAKFSPNFLILSGLLHQQANLIMRRYQTFGFELLDRRDLGDWSGLLFAKI